MSAFIALPVINFGSWQDDLNSAMAILTFIVLPLAPLLVFLFLHKQRHKLKSPDFKDKFITLYFGVNVKRFWAILMMPLFLFRRILFAIAVTNMPNYPGP